METRPQITLIRRDLRRLDDLVGGLLSRRGNTVAAFLTEELARARVVTDDTVAPNVVTMNSRLRFRDEVSGRERVATLVYPGETGDGEDRISILTPAGSALLGLSEGQTIGYVAPSGETRRLTVLKVLAQPGEGRA